jgi:aerobic-type carbon monoxide dehydrogenase small subunit (CoxS/CutS family)
MKIKLRVNGVDFERDVRPLRRLLDLLRVDLGLVGTKEGCSEGECGACSVIVDGELVCSCLIPAAQVDGADIKTIEGIAAEKGIAADLLTCMADSGAAQCGICTPGFVMAGLDWLTRGGVCESDRERRDDVRRAVAGNLCRCTGYMKIIDGIAAAAAKSASRKRAD